MKKLGEVKVTFHCEREPCEDCKRNGDKVAAILASLLTDAVAKKLSAESEPTARNRENLMTVEEAAKFLGLTPLALRRRVTRGTIKPVRVGRSLRFRRDQLVKP